MTGLTERDLKMFKLVCEILDIGMVADKLDMSEDAVYQRFYWIRDKRKEWQRNINIINNAERRCKRLEKLLTPRDLAK